MKFWDTKIGKILSYGIHEHNSGIALTKGNVALAIKMLKMPNHYTIDEVIERLEISKKHFKKCKDSIDYIYSEVKKLEGYE